ncbi:phytanoyl-CoA dioxygenase family protein [Thalassobaculum sp. OXR-137]|uniref:phytanoyl-CoA dioxygenase family protein n=1 Tax=Thalassobaculum sp. OXR-137 TaxID=3100173 RepID=UPI002AC97061|nr:phytanoyl-CoA dioxygenase family protein [Thalassobaculum sp. OXR-137]WPZ32919.1 phytanoyl-CoA dioxygenase family protein [Thalassobaculum sp. OXR-137]
MSLDPPHAVPPTLRVLENVLPPQTIEILNGLNAWALGDRPAQSAGLAGRKSEKTLRDMIAEGTIGHPRGLFALFKGTEIEAVWHEVLGPDIALCLSSTIMRDFNPVNRPTPARWHYDAFLLGMSTPMLNTWVPLNDVGVTAPGMTMCRIPHWPHDYWQRAVEIADENGMIPATRQEEVKYSNDEILALAEKEPESPIFDTVLNAGDVIVFDHQHIHGTQHSLVNAGRRRSLEIRVVSLKSALHLRDVGNPHMFIPFE